MVSRSSPAVAPRDHAKWLVEQKALASPFTHRWAAWATRDSTVEAFIQTKAEHGTIDVLVNNAVSPATACSLKMSRGTTGTQVIEPI